MAGGRSLASVAQDPLTELVIDPSFRFKEFLQRIDEYYVKRYLVCNKLG